MTTVWREREKDTHVRKDRRMQWRWVEWTTARECSTAAAAATYGARPLGQAALSDPPHTPPRSSQHSSFTYRTRRSGSCRQWERLNWRQQQTDRQREQISRVLGVDVIATVWGHDETGDVEMVDGVESARRHGLLCFHANDNSNDMFLQSGTPVSAAF